MTRAVLALAVIALMAPGCVLRTLEVKSAPSGATVYLDDQAVGKTPLTMKFDFYGTRAIRVAKAGYHPHQGEVALSAPWYEWFPLDFFSEILWPGTIHDRHDVAVELQKIEAGPIDSAATAEFASRAQRRLLESRVQGYVRAITKELASLDSTLGDAPVPSVRRAAIARADRLHEALTALPHAGSVAALAVWESAHRAVVRGE